MKKLTFYFFLFAGIGTVSVSCTDDDSKSTSVNVQPVIDAAANGSWKITNYVDSGTNHTSQFSAYEFVFSGNTVTATSAANVYTGVWSVTSSHSDDSHDDDSHNSDDIDFNISFTSPANFTELSDDWDIISYSSAKIELIDISGGNGGTDYLTFEKI